MKIIFVFVVFCSCIYLYSASHFRGAMIYWKESDSGDSIDIDYRESWRRTSQHPECNDTTIAEAANSSSEGYLEELYTYSFTDPFGLYYTPFSEPFLYTCTDYSLNEDWQTGRGHLDFPLNKSSDRNLYTLQFVGCCWIDTLVEGGGTNWQVQTKINTSIRADTGRMNASPRVDFPPIVRLKYGCNHTIRLPVSDYDGDTVRCRWAESDECYGIYDSFPNARMDKNTCTISYSADYLEGWYPVAVQIEDFNDAISSQPLSSVPLQFLVSVEDNGHNCTAFEHERPKFVNFTLPDRACVGVSNNTDFTTDIYIQTGGNISEVNTISPLGLVKSSLQKSNQSGHWHISVSWNSSRTDTVNNVFCFTAVDDQGLSSDQRCITLLAGVPPAAIVPDSKMPTLRVVHKTQRTWSIQFDREDKPAIKSAYIYLYLSDGTLVERIDVYNSSGVSYTTSGNRTRIHFTTTVDLIPSQQYYFLFGQGLVQGKSFCGAESKAVLDPSFWTFSVHADPTTTVPPSSNVEVRCYSGGDLLPCDKSYMNCTENWQFPNPCSRENILAGRTNFSHPSDHSKFILCDLSGKMYIVYCPFGELFYPWSSQCDKPDQAVSKNVSNPCTREHILAGDMYFPYPGDVTKYIHCDIWGHPWERACAPGKQWDQADLTCVVFTTYKPCEQHGPMTQSLFPHQCDPHKYIHCDGNGQSFVQSCQLDFVFLISALTCVPPRSYPGTENLQNTCSDLIHNVIH